MRDYFIAAAIIISAGIFAPILGDDADHHHSDIAHTARVVDTADIADSAAVVVDTARIAADTAALRMKRERAAPYGAAGAEAFDPSTANRQAAFRSDGAGMSDILRFRALSSVYVPFSLSSGMNRLLPLGGAGIGTPSSRYSLSLEALPDRFGSGAVSAAQAAGFAVDPWGNIEYEPFPDLLFKPELHIFWENGPFDGNTLNLRLTRPIGRRLMLSVFSDYRYSAPMRFDHEGNDVVGLYEFFRSDTSTIMNHGYNPLVEEHVTGASFMWVGSDSSKFRTDVIFSALQNEYALDIPAAVVTPNDGPTLDRLNWAQANRDITRINAAILDKKIGIFTVNARTSLKSESMMSIYDTDSTIANGSGGVREAAASADIALPVGVGLAVEGGGRETEFFGGKRARFPLFESVLFFRRELSINTFVIDIDASAGAAGFSYDDTSHYYPKAEAAVGVSPIDYLRFDAFVKYDGITVLPDYDTSFYYLPRPWRDNYLTFGMSSVLQTKYAGASLGYQLTEGIDPFTVCAAWPESVPPYFPPTHSILIAQWFPRLAGFNWASRAVIADTKPYLKLAANLSYLIRPKGMEHTFETELGFDYWSERDPTIFAGFEDYGWNDPIYDLNLKITAHVKTFRLFWKVDNLMNFRHSYVPGYFSPGLTFRWGINWFLM